MLKVIMEQQLVPATNSELNPEWRVLIVDDERDWHTLWHDALGQPEYALIFAQDTDEALSQLNNSFDLVIVNVLLRDQFYNGWLADVTRIFDKIADQGMISLMVTGSHKKDSGVVPDLFALQRRYVGTIRDYRAKEELRATYIMSEIVHSLMFPHASSPSLPQTLAKATRAYSATERHEIFSIALCICHGFIENNLSEENNDDGLISLVESVQTWIHGTIVERCDEDINTAWVDFKRKPKKTSRQNLKSALVKLNHPDEATLIDLVDKCQREIIQRKGADLYRILSSERYMPHQVHHICAQIDDSMPGLSGSTDQREMALWAANQAKTGDMMKRKVVILMQEINPTVLLLEYL